RAAGRVAEAGVLGAEDQVAHAGQLAAAGQTVAVHLRDNRLAVVPHPQPALDALAQTVAVLGDAAAAGVAARTRREVVPGAEGPPRRLEHDHAHVVALVERAQRRFEVVTELGAHRV